MSDSTAREITQERIFIAPRELVWKVWTDPDQIAKWWGPNGFTTTTKDHDLRPGGEWNFTMHGPDGTDYRNEITYTVVTPPERLEYDHGPTPKFSTTVLFAEEPVDKTRLTMTTRFATPEIRNMVIEKFGAIEGMKQTLGRLADYLSEMSRS